MVSMKSTFFAIWLFYTSSDAFSLEKGARSGSVSTERSFLVPQSSDDSMDTKPAQSDFSRRSFLDLHASIFTAPFLFASAESASAAVQRQPLPDLLYRILRVKEATQQETRLIRSGKFKDVQRANVKLAVRFMVDNYRLNDAFVGASAYLDGNTRRVDAGQVGQTAVQNLYTILEYFDSSDVQNLKVGAGDGMGGKEDLVLKGLEATRKSIDDFLAYFPQSEVDSVAAKIQSENELNAKEFDNSLGQILNLAPVKP